MKTAEPCCRVSELSWCRQLTLQHGSAFTVPVCSQSCTKQIIASLCWAQPLVQPEHSSMSVLYEHEQWLAGLSSSSPVLTRDHPCSPVLTFLVWMLWAEYTSLPPRQVESVYLGHCHFLLLYSPGMTMPPSLFFFFSSPLWAVKS